MPYRKPEDWDYDNCSANIFLCTCSLTSLIYFNVHKNVKCEKLVKTQINLYDSLIFNSKIS